MNPLRNGFLIISHLFGELWIHIFQIKMFGQWSNLTVGSFLLGILIINFLCLEIHAFMHRKDND